MKNIVLKIQEGDMFRFYIGGDKDEIVVGSRRSADICIKSQYVQPEQLRIVRKNNKIIRNILVSLLIIGTLILGGYLGRKFPKLLYKKSIPNLGMLFSYFT